MTAYYNENDPKAAAWLRELIKQGHIAPGEVDERSIADVRPHELAGFTQCHFFAGIGGWSYALRLAGWPDDRPVWTGSCPCQPFSVIGKQRGADDERHLWPVFFDLIGQRRPPVVFGEQVASKAGLQWLAGVRLDLEGCGYKVAAADLCAASVGAPHRRQRIYWVADSGGTRLERQPRDGDNFCEQGRVETEQDRPATKAGSPSSAAPCVDAVSVLRRMDLHDTRRACSRLRMPPDRRMDDRSIWSRFGALPCADGWRRVEPGTFPLVTRLPKGMGFDSNPGAPFHDSEAWVMRLRGYGNAIVPQVGAAFVRAYAESV